jgi:two-component system chemotaxis sensor kinase CheA
VAVSRSFETPDGKGFIKLFSAEDRAAMMAGNAPGAPAASQPAETAKAAVATPAEPAPAAASAARIAPAAKEPPRSLDAGSVRVETAKLDHLMDMVGEIVIAQSLIRHNPAFAATTDSRLLGDLAQLARVTGEVQRATMSMRMIPVSHVFQRVERVIRDLSRKAGKIVTLETVGSETELDKTVAEELSDPLLHMVRNSVDHGIEKAEERLAAGKTAEARIRLTARHQGGLVIIAISDDGRGLNGERIRAKAEERGLIAPNTQLTDTETYNLIFEPGFSTAEKITDVSGRGVGMDVVRRNVEKLRGRIDTESTPGQGTTFSLKLPLTLAIIDGLVVEVGSDRYIIPLSCVREMFRPQDDALFTVEGRDEMLLVRGKLLPVVRLNQRLGIYGMAQKPSEGLIVVVESHNRCFCLLVDDLLGKQEVVIKSLGEALKNIPGLSGCAVLGDGRVGLILDIDGIFRGNR